MKSLVESGLIGAWKGASVLVAGNGPSLRYYSKEFYDSFEYSIGVNTIANTFKPTLIYDVEQRPVPWVSPKEPYDLGIPWITCHHLKGRKGNDMADYWVSFPPKGTGFFVIDPIESNDIGKAHTSVFGALNIAYKLGAKNIYIIGVDFCVDPDGEKYHDNRMPHHKQNWYLNLQSNRHKKNLKWFETAFIKLENVGVTCYDLSLFGKLKGIQKVNSIVS